MNSILPVRPPISQTVRWPCRAPNSAGGTIVRRASPDPPPPGGQYRPLDDAAVKAIDDAVYQISRK